MKVKGKAFVFGDNINTDEIIPARYLHTHEASSLAPYCMEDVRPGFGTRDDIKGGILVAGENFGCGSSREHAPLAIKASGIGCVIAKSFARIFLRNSINIGLPVAELPEALNIKENNNLLVDFNTGIVQNLTTGTKYVIQPYPEFLKEIIKYGGWLELASKVYLKPVFPK
jgi:3-isopropylmalate/(R)-2-methylmalate dehydratase small subunit